MVLQNLDYSKPERKEKEHTYVKKALKKCGYPNWAIIRSITMHSNNGQTSTLSSFMSQVYQRNSGRIFSKHDIPEHIRPSHTLRQQLARTDFPNAN